VKWGWERKSGERWKNVKVLNGKKKKHKRRNRCGVTMGLTNESNGE
jgi:hypothetical protein